MVLLQFQVSEMAEFLKYGISGLSAIAFLLSFFLLNRESGRPRPRPEMLRNIRMFMWVTVILGLVSGVSMIINPNQPTPNAIAKAQPKAKKLVNAVSRPSVLQVEVFYQTAAKTLAQQLADELENYGEYDVKLTALTAERRQKWGISRSQIRHEVAEKQAAIKLQTRLEKVLPQDVSFYLKQITSSSPDYISVFVWD